ncbi:hypothetical protein [Yoonia algicola]|uniref:Cadherin domain-containing protein n=1 Tax=Yoonia algicola TaxID=3137368 RepID=A0AAN0MFW4_9RHOB
MTAALIGIGSPELVHSDPNLSQIDQRVTALLDGGWVVTWTRVDVDRNEASAVFAKVFGPDGEPLATEFLVNETPGVGQENPEIVTLPNGNFLVVWTALDQTAGLHQTLHYRQFDQAGLPLAEASVFEASINASSGDYSVSVLANGGLVVAWKDVGDQLIYQKQLDADLQPVGEIERVSDIEAFADDYIDINALEDGGWLAVWRSSAAEKGIFVRQFASDGSPVGEASLVNVLGAPVNDFVTSTISEPSIEVLADGSFIVVWQASGADGLFDQDSDIYMQRFSSDGIALGDTTRVNDLEPGSQTFSQVLALPDGGWLVAWTDETLDLGGGTVQIIERNTTAQRFDAEGNKVGDNMIVSGSPDIRQQYPEMVLLSDGTILIAWWANDFASSDPKSRADVVQQVFTLPEIAFSDAYDENRDSTDVLATVPAADFAGATGFEITGGDPGGATPWFAINALGEITLTEAGVASAANDFELAGNGYILAVQPTNDAGNVGEAVNVSLQVADANDVAPLVTLLGKIGAIREDFDLDRAC